jgi:hypothetical protein
MEQLVREEQVEQFVAQKVHAPESTYMPVGHEV